MAGIASLAAAFAVEGRLIGEDDAALARIEPFDARPVPDQSDHLTLTLGREIAGEFGAAQLIGDVEPDFAGSGLARPLPRGARRCFLLSHGGIKAFAIDRHALRSQRVFGQIIGETISVIELECSRARQRIARAHPRCRLVEQAEAVLQRLAEPRFLLLERRFDQRLRADEFGKSPAHLCHERWHHAVHQRLGRAQQVRVAHRAAHDPAQHIAAPLIGGEHAIGNEKARGAQVIGDDAVARLGFAVGRSLGQLAALGDQRLEGVGIVIVMDALHHRGDAFEPHAGVDARARKIADDLVRRLDELHEDEVPDLDEAIAIFVGAARRPAGNVIAVIVENFAAWSARAIRAHRPEIILGGDTDDAVFGQSGDLLPQIEGLIVVMIDGRGQPVGIETPFFRQQCPGMIDRLFLEVITEAEIAEHLEECVMPRSVTDIVEIVMLTARADAFLRRDGGRIRARFEAGEDVLERHHARIDEHQRRIVVRHQRRARHAGMADALEIFEK